VVKLNFNLSVKQKSLVKSVITRVPRNEEEVKRLFYKLEDTLGFQEVRAYSSFPDASAFYKGKEINIEFEYLSSFFKKHQHKVKDCDLIICWEDDETCLEIPVVELSTLGENWLKARAKLMMKYTGLIHAEEYGTKDKDVSREKARLESDMEKYNFDQNDAIAEWMGMNKKSLSYYQDFYNPECIGGQLECEKWDIDPKYIEINPSLQRLVPIVLCKKCENKTKCRLGKGQQVGFYFLLSFDNKRPRKVGIQRRQIGDERILSHMKPVHLPMEGYPIQKKVVFSALSLL
jgi:hypothetical protein